MSLEKVMAVGRQWRCLSKIFYYSPNQRSEFTADSPLACVTILFRHWSDELAATTRFQYSGRQIDLPHSRASPSFCVIAGNTGSEALVYGCHK
jgi:hypothetical protein